MRKRHFIFLLVLLSGFAGLIYEIVWTRQLTLLFGVSIYAVSAVVAVFMLGLAAGSYLFGRMADRAGNPLTIFGIIELSVAGYALIFPLIAKLIQYLYIALYDADYSRPQMFFLRFMLTFVLLLPPTLLMGGTLPVAAKLCAHRFNQIGNMLARLYGLNTLGAVLGAALAGFFLLRWLGATGATYIAIVCNLVVGVAALWMSRYTSTALPEAGARDHPAKSKKKSTPAVTPQLRGGSSRSGHTSGDQRTGTLASSATSSPISEALPPADKNDPSLRRKVLVAIFISGFCALGYEVLWTKMLILILGNSSWAFGAVLVAFLASIATGSLLISPWLDRQFNRMQLFSLLQVLIAITAFLSLIAFRWLAGAKIGGGTGSLLPVVLGQIVTSFLIMAPPTLMSGAILPLAARLCAGSIRKASTHFGLTLALNTAGSVLGSLAAGYILISRFGVQNSIILLAALNAMLGVWLSQIKVSGVRKTGIVTKGAALLAANALIVSLFLYKPPLRLPPSGYDLRYYQEDAAGIFSIFQHKSAGAKVFAINSVTEVSTDYNSMTAFRLMAYLPYLLHEKPNDALVITFGAGIVAGSLAQLDLSSLECVEINPKARDVGRFFADENHHATDNPKLRLFIEDGRNFLSTTSRKYDIITADATHPTGADSWVLFTKEYYELCRRHLEAGGLFMQWLPLHALSENHYLTILATAAEAFDDLSVWFSGLEGFYGHSLMIGAMDSLTLNYEQVREKMQLPLIQRDLAEIGIDSPEGLLAHFMANKKSLQPVLDNRAVNTDNLAITAFPDAIPTTKWTENNLAQLARARTMPMIVNMPSDALYSFERLHTASGWLIDAAFAASSGDLQQTTEGVERIEAADVDLKTLSLAFSSSARKIIEIYLSACEQASSVADTSSVRLYLDKANAVLPALRYQPDLARAYAGIGRMYERLGDFQSAQDAYENALERNPNDERSLRNLARLKRMNESKLQNVP